MLKEVATWRLSGWHDRLVCTSRQGAGENASVGENRRACGKQVQESRLKSLVGKSLNRRQTGRWYTSDSLIRWRMTWIALRPCDQPRSSR